ncbi:protein of unknown function [Candidatus Filomicrobium marinum]|uniref:Uncharacterized protein n=1 Tax=Candidatus Filomicrobium marinum TaxID=1608628 RepID=A0A0D6JBZ0_9HYPH|nr:protein of unknown function [Candidatus Filomicrobium marinum]
MWEQLPPKLQREGVSVQISGETSPALAQFRDGIA